jgi:ATP-dependent Clp protease ATP-binding subunit ClpX
MSNSRSNSGNRGRRSNTCSFCGKSHRDAGPMVEGTSDVFICAACIELCHNLIKEEKRKADVQGQEPAQDHPQATRDL